MQFKQYPSYKNSGVEWLGDVPEHWQIVRTKDIFNHRKEEALEDDEIVTAFRDGQVTLRKNRRTDGFTNSIKEHGYQHINSGDLVIHEMDAFAGAIGVSDSSGKSTPVYTVCYAKNENINHHFYSHFFRTMAKTGFINSLAKGIRVRSTEFRWNESRNVYLVEPPKADQEKIVSFLDTETARIDNLISKQEKLIELLEEQRKSIISHAVTKGLNPNAPMKDSGVEWLGDVPEHWDITRLKNIGKSIIGLTYSPNEICDADDDSYLVLRSSNVQNGQLSFLDNVYVKSSVSEKLKIKKNDILICSRNGSRDLIGKNIIIKNPPKNSTFGAFMTVYRSEYADYVYWILNSYIFKAQAGSYLTTTVNQLTINNLNNMTVPFAPISEQDEIVEFLSTENLKFNNLISKQKALIEKLKEYRASIISHAVTGKIDVREFY
ncbi:putative type I restriction-modification system specificity determinant for hsdM and hsdR (HsdS) [Acinetobacter baumannii SDF]|uniref:Type I restriction-modification system specificity determinant for hsdM and hsdR (HsdS) n=1 Tax=Acinetobacter baumannii (strain SDF) TaxID=509170 RepID=B0VN96_ACIBS|nr:putative type I restriction-modification system specificity determinant for hsdM and hsdR (HsdS) [Acinetobacter baumannii SDF]